VTPGFLCAVRGPIMLITLGVLLSIDHFGTVSFTRTWPVLLIVFGLFKLMERSGSRQPQ
jgi:hypothetical protein